MDFYCDIKINHAVLAVGYGEEDGKGFYKVKNSWSDKWGEDGYFRIKNDDAYGPGMCGINQYAYWIE